MDQGRTSGARSVPGSDTPGGGAYPRRASATPRPEGAVGYRATKRSSKLGKRLRREARAERVKRQVGERVAAFRERMVRALRRLGVLVAGIAVTVAVLALLATGINAVARWAAKRDAERASSPQVRAEQARENLLIIGVSETSGANFLAVRLDQENRQILGVAIPGGAFMEVPGQGYERIGESLDGGPEVSLAAVSNYLAVPFEHYVIVDDRVYQDALTNQSLRDIMANVQTSDLAAGELDRIAEFIASVSGERTALVPLPVKPIDLGGQTYFEPQRDEIADLLLEWWDVRVGAEQGAIRVIVYNGVGTPGIAGLAAQELISAGMRVIDTRNADRFDYDTTLIVVQDGDLSQGEKVREAIRTGEVVDQPSEQDVADVIVIIGRDYQPPQSGGS